MKFFIPNTKKAEHEAVYTDLAATLKDQLRITITNRKIFSISYTHDKREWYAEVGKLDQMGKKNEIVAIFEANPYIVFTKTKDGSRGITILVSKDEVHDVKDFE